MSHEFTVTGPTGLTLYVVLYNAADATQAWRTDTHVFETVVAANWTHYSITMTEAATGTGVYSADFPTQINANGDFPYDVRLQAASIDPTDAVFGGGDVQWDGSSVVTAGPYVTTRAYVKALLGITDSSLDAQIDQMLPGITTGISRYVKRNVVAADIVETRNGQGTDWLRVWNPPLNTLTSITFDYLYSSQVTVDGSQFIFDGFSGTIKFKPQATGYRGFAEGWQNLQVNYNGGFSPVPDDIQNAAALMVKKLLELYDAERLVSEKVEGNRRQKYDTIYAAAAGGSLSDAMFAEAKTLLDPYRMIRCY